MVMAHEDIIKLDQECDHMTSYGVKGNEDALTKLTRSAKYVGPVV